MRSPRLELVARPFIDHVITTHRGTEAFRTFFVVSQCLRVSYSSPHVTSRFGFYGPQNATIRFAASMHSDSPGTSAMRT